MAIRQPRANDAEFRRSRHDGQRMSLEQYLALPEEKPYLEYIDGMVRQKSMVNRAHRNLIRQIDARFWLYEQEHGGEGGPEGDVRLSPRRNVLPDASYYRPGVPAEQHDLPTVVVKVRSPSETMREQRAKCRMYREGGVPVAWLIDPASRTVEVFEGAHEGRVLGEGDVLTTAEMPGFALPLAELFATLDR